MLLALDCQANQDWDVRIPNQHLPTHEISVAILNHLGDNVVRETE